MLTDVSGLSGNNKEFTRERRVLEVFLQTKVCMFRKGHKVLKSYYNSEQYKKRPASTFMTEFTQLIFRADDDCSVTSPHKSV